jgi:hypothetical protein
MFPILINITRRVTEKIFFQGRPRLHNGKTQRERRERIVCLPENEGGMQTLTLRKEEEE